MKENNSTLRLLQRRFKLQCIYLSNENDHKLSQTRIKRFINQWNFFHFECTDASIREWTLFDAYRRSQGSKGLTLCGWRIFLAILSNKAQDNKYLSLITINIYPISKTYSSSS